MTDPNSWLIERIADDEVRRLAGRHVADPLAGELRVDIVADPHTEMMTDTAGPGRHEPSGWRTSRRVRLW